MNGKLSVVRAQCVYLAPAGSGPNHPNPANIGHRSVNADDDPADQIVAQPDQQGVVARAHPDIAARGCGKLAMFAIIDPAVIGGLGPVKPLPLDEFMAGAGRFLRCRSFAGRFCADLFCGGFLVVVRALAPGVGAAIFAVVVLLGISAGRQQKRQGA